MSWVELTFTSEPPSSKALRHPPTIPIARWKEQNAPSKKLVDGFGPVPRARPRRRYMAQTTRAYGLALNILSLLSIYLSILLLPASCFLPVRQPARRLGEPMSRPAFQAVWRSRGAQNREPRAAAISGPCSGSAAR
jgi:hypothetical protein